ncbi:MAG: hypothetical protein Q7K43_00035, partial [Candidatus Woesearchaeota archaeon]|nr:hypothetical protein [Candidatus Woesearchaeota archaeon]
NSVGRALYGAYIQGVDELELEFEDLDIFPDIKKNTERLLGFEIVSHTGGSCLIKSVAPALETEFDGILRRILILLVETAKDTYVTAKTQKFDVIQELIERERTNNKLVAFCLRVLNKKGHKEHKRVTLLYALICELEYLADEFREIIVSINKSKKKISHAVMEIFSVIVRAIELFYEIIYRFDMKKFVELKGLLNKEVDDKTILLLQQTRDIDTLILHHLSNISAQIYHATLFSGAYEKKT